MIEKSILINDKFKFDFDHMLFSLAIVRISTSRFISFLTGSSPERRIIDTGVSNLKGGFIFRKNDTFEFQKILQIKIMLKLTLSINQFQTSRPLQAQSLPW